MEHWGYVAIFLGSLVEGETALITAAFLAHRGYFTPAYVFLTVLTAAQIIDWSYFLVGRYRGKNFVQNHRRLESRLNTLTGWIEAHPTVLLFGYRFLYGVRIPLVIAFGLSNFSTARFALSSLFGTMLWVGCYLAAGFYFGRAIETELAVVREHEVYWLLLLVVAVALVFFFIRHRKSINAFWHGAGKRV